MTRPSVTVPDGYVDLQVNYTERRISLSGEFDIASAPDLARAVAAVQRVSTDDITIDLGNVRFIDAAGLGAIVGARAMQAEQGAGIVVSGASALVRKIFQLANLANLFDEESLRDRPPE